MKVFNKIFLFFYTRTNFRKYYYLPVILDQINFRIQSHPVYNSLRGKTDTPATEVVVYMCPEELPLRAGLTDRLRGVVSVYRTCKQMNFDFRIFYTSPQLQDYLVPNKYDWSIKTGEIDYNWKEIFAGYLINYHSDLNDVKQIKSQQYFLDKYCKKLGRKYKQVHIYTNTPAGDSDFHLLFSELFKPSTALEKALQPNLQSLGGADKYVSVSFRFRNLFGDFEQDKAKGDLTAEEKDNYLKRAIETITSVHKLHPEGKVLVAGDSAFFLGYVKDLDFVYVAPGEITHSGFPSNADGIMKTFVDMFLIANAKVIYQVKDPLLHHSGFPIHASKIYNKEYKEIRLCP